MGKIFVLDKIRILKFAEMFQYSFIFYFLTLFTTDILNDYIFNETEEEIKKMSKIKLLINILFHLFALVVLLFYLRKIALAVPSISNMIYPNFKPYTTVEYVLHIVTVFLFLETLKGLHLKIDFLRNNIDVLNIFKKKKFK